MRRRRGFDVTNGLTLIVLSVVAVPTVLKVEALRSLFVLLLIGRSPILRFIEVPLLITVKLLLLR